jgi:hypothetical protein
MSEKDILNIKSYRTPCTNFVLRPRMLRSPKKFDQRPLFCISEGKYCPKMGTGVRKWVHIRYRFFLEKWLKIAKNQLQIKIARAKTWLRPKKCASPQFYLGT